MEHELNHSITRPLLILAIFLNSTGVFAQTLVSSGGGSGTVPGGSASWSVGEPIIGTGTLPGGIVTQGFQQSQGGGPENDDCADAIAITCGSATSGTTVGALPETLDAFTGNTQDAPSVWYMFVGSNSGDPGAAPGSPGDQVTLSTCNDVGLTAGSADYDSKLDVYTGTCNALSWVGGNDDGGGCADYTSLFGFPTIVGTTYYVRVYGFTTDSYGDFVLAMACAPPCIPVPLNDGCAAPEVVMITPFDSPSYVDGTTDCAMVENFYPSCDPFGEIKGVWYAFTTDESGQATVRLEGITATDLNITLYSVAPCDGPPVEVNCNTVLTLPFNFSLSTQPNTAYRLLVYSSTASSGSFAIAVTLDEPPPVNDECADAISLTTGYSCVAVTAGSVSGAQQSLGPLTCPPFTSPAALDVWYSFVANSTTSTVEVMGSASFDAIIDIREGVCPGVNIACADATGNGGSEEVAFTTVPGTTYYVRVYDYGTFHPVTPEFTICAYGTFECSTDLSLDVTIPGSLPGVLPTFDLVYVPTGEVVQSGGGGIGNTAPAINPIPLCTDDGPFRLEVADMPAGGSYKLRTATAPFSRLIDNIDAVTGTSSVTEFTVAPSALSSNGAVQLPIGPTEFLYTSCDKYFWKKGEFIVVNEDADVAAEWVPGGGTAGQSSTTGYDFWFYDPNGGYSFIRQRRHNVTDGFGNVGSPRTCHMQVNNWAAANWIPNQVPLNVRVRAVVNNVPKNWGPACRFMRDDALALCPPTKLMDVPGNPFISCNVFRDFNNQSINRLYARPVAGATKYRFTMNNAELGGSPIIREVNTYYLTLGWNAGIAPPLNAGEDYDVTVQAFKGGVWCTAGESCKVTINNAVNGGQQNSAMDASTDAALSLYPNPNRGDQLYISLTAIEVDVNTVSMDLYDLTGKRMIARTIAAQDGFVNTMVDLNGDLAAGMYLVNITAGEYVYTQRLVIQP